MVISLQQQSKQAIMQGSMRQTPEAAQRFIQTVRFQKLAPLSYGYGEIARQMRAYPTLSPQETDIAIRAHRNGLAVSQLAQLTPFQEHLALEEAQRYLSTGEEIRPSYQRLFAEKKSNGEKITIPDIVALGHHDLIFRWIAAYDSMFKDLALPLDDFFNEALAKLLPYEATTYDPDIIPGTFPSWASRFLFWRLHGVAQKRARELRSLPVEMKRASTTAFKDTNRRSMVSLDAPLQSNSEETALSYADTIASPQPLHNTLESQSAIHHLFHLAGLTQAEQEALVSVAVADFTNDEVGERMRRSERTIRYYRERAIAKLLQVGDRETLQAILQGDRETGTQAGHLEDISQAEIAHIPPKEATKETQPVIQHPCMACGKEVIQPSRKQSMEKWYCDSACRTVAYRERKQEPIKEIACPHCTTLFLPKKQKGRAQIYCQDACRLQANWKKQAMKRKEQRHQAKAVRNAKVL